MKLRKIIPVGIVAILALAAGCDDPSNVGLGLANEDGGDPLRISLVPESLEEIETEDVSGGIRSTIAFAGNVSSILFGEVDDPVFGSSAAKGYMRFARSANTVAFREGTMERAEIRLVNNYQYGDTLTQQTVIVSEIANTWDPVGARSDTTFDVGPEITRFTFSAKDSLISIPLPEDWIAANDTTLRSATFERVFPGFHFSTESATAIVGVGAALNGTGLVMISSGDSVFYSPDQVFTHVDATQLPVDNGRIMIRDGVGAGLAFSLSAPDSLLGKAGLARATLTLQEDTLLLGQNLPANFVRPRLLQISIYGEEADGTLDRLALASPNVEGKFIFADGDITPNGTLLNAIQATLNGESQFVRYLIRPSAGANTLNASFFFPVSDQERGPRLVITAIVDS